MANHIRRDHEGIKPDIRCHLCNRSVATPSVLRNHMEQVHEKKRPYACTLCDLKFAQKAHLVTHYKGKHKQIVKYTEVN